MIRDPEIPSAASILQYASWAPSGAIRMRNGIPAAEPAAEGGKMPSSVPVLIVGGGPVGLSLALELGSRNVPCLLVEQGDGTIAEAKMFATGIRTLEFCRRWGIAERVKNWGF